MIDRTVKYFSERLEYLKGLVKECNEKKHKYEIEKKELFVQIEHYRTKIDEAYDVFSPNSAKNQFIKDQIIEFEKKLNNINESMEKIEEKLLSYNNEIKKIEEIIQEIHCFIEKQSALNNATELKEKKIDCIDISKDAEDFGQDSISEKEELMIDKKRIRDIIYKCENCSAFMNMDINRSKLEIQSIIDNLKNLISN